MRHRLLTELQRSHAGADVERALASLAVRIEGTTAVISREDQPPRSPGDREVTPLFGAAPIHVDTARIEPRVYGSTPTSEARIRLLDAAGSIAHVVQVHAPAESDGTHRGRLAIDVPRRIARAFGLDVAEPGDRFAGRFMHAFFDDEAIVDEAARAGLRFVARRGPWVDLERSSDRQPERAAPFSVEVIRALALVREAERLRVEAPPEHAVRVMRERGRGARRRGPIGRARLRRAIGWVDAAYPIDGANCFRRVLVEIGLDAGAAEETLVFGLDVGRTGHVAFKDSEDRSFDVAFEVPAEPSNERAEDEQRNE